MSNRTLADVGLINSYNVGRKDSIDAENSAKLNYATQACLEDLLSSKNPKIDKKMLRNFEIPNILQANVFYTLPALVLGFYKQHKLFVGASLVAGLTLACINHKNVSKISMNTLILSNWSFMDPAFQKAYEARDSRYIAHTLPKDQSWQSLDSSVQWRYRIF